MLAIATASSVALSLSGGSQVRRQTLDAHSTRTHRRTILTLRDRTACEPDAHQLTRVFLTYPEQVQRKVSPKMKGPAAFAYGLPGGKNILGEFDPAGFLNGKDKLEVYRLREAELAHGRVAMLASLGFIVQEKFHPLFSGDGGPAIDQIPQLPIWLWGVMLAGIGSAEQARIAKGWAKVDHLGLKPEDPAEFALMQEKELSHGRLAMIAAAGFLAQEAVTKSTWGAYWGDASF